MDISDFEKTMRPNGKRSQMDPYINQIFELKGKGYANWQIKEFLAHNGIHVTTEAVRQFIKSRGNKLSTTPKFSNTFNVPVDSNPADALLSATVPKKEMHKKANKYITGGLDEQDIDNLVSSNVSKK
jgi:hypothetical protein